MQRDSQSVCSGTTGDRQFPCHCEISSSLGCFPRYTALSPSSVEERLNSRNALGWTINKETVSCFHISLIANLLCCVFFVFVYVAGSFNDGTSERICRQRLRSFQQPSWTAEVIGFFFFSLLKWGQIPESTTSSIAQRSCISSSCRGETYTCWNAVSWTACIKLELMIVLVLSLVFFFFSSLIFSII